MERMKLLFSRFYRTEREREIFPTIHTEHINCFSSFFLLHFPFSHFYSFCVPPPFHHRFSHFDRTWLYCCIAHVRTHIGKGIQREGANINKSLLALGNCINALANQCKQGHKRKGAHIPYRN